MGIIFKTIRLIRTITKLENKNKKEKNIMQLEDFQDIVVNIKNENEQEEYFYFNARSLIIFLFNLDGFIEKRENPKNLIDELIFQMA
jgi:hypothetical protein